MLVLLALLALWGGGGVVHAVDIVHAIDIVHAVHTLDIAIEDDDEDADEDGDNDDEDDDDGVDEQALSLLFPLAVTLAPLAPWPRGPIRTRSRRPEADQLEVRGR